MNGAIACGHIETAMVGKEILLAGGNAFDAAIASLCAMFVTEPCMASLGGGGFALFQHQNNIHQLDFFCQTPREKVEFPELQPVEIDFGGSTELYFAGHASVAIPGIPALIQKLHKNLASMPLKELLQPAIALAKNGVEINWFQHADIHLLRDLFALQPKSSAHLFENGKVKPIGSIVKMPALASTLDFIAHNGIQDFYRGDIAALFFKEHAEKGGQQTKQDWINYEAKWGKAMEFFWNGHAVFTTQLPSIGGLFLRSFLDHFQSTDVEPLSADHYSIIAKAFQKEREYREDRKKLEKRIPQIKDNVHWQNLVNKGTSHFNIIDSMGNAISLTTTVGSGSGMFIGDTGIYLNNMLGEEGLLPNGVNSWVPNTRLHSSTCPTIIKSESGNHISLYGSGGSTRIPYAIAQVVVNQHALQCSLKNAINLPRLHDDLSLLQAEPGFDTPETIRANIWQEKSLYFGGVHAIHKEKNKVQAVGDARREGFGEVW